MTESAPHLIMNQCNLTLIELEAAMEHDPNCHVEMFHKPFDETDVSAFSKANLLVSGMGCHNCAIRVRNAILQLDGVNWVDIDLETGKTLIAYDATKISPE